ncbi:MAG: sulfur transferase domain-containing protein [Boseongicola sp.]|nr:sulfur transferase domain-containing protein [Boseongicola sp.]MDD9976540.1 sulfur transferase domain-containing protein [Boseongicola sp.]
MEMTQLAPNLFAGAQISEADLAMLASEGFTDVVCNRPDFEHPDSDPSSKLEDMSEKLGMAFHYLPITPGEPFVEEAEKLSSVVSRPNAKVFAYCRSGARVANAWSLVSEAGTGNRR